MGIDKSMIRYFAVVGVACAATVLITIRVYSQPSSHAEFTAKVRVDHHRYPGGEYVKTEEVVKAYRQDGSSVQSRQLQAPDGRAVEQRTVRDLGAGREVVADGLTDSLTTYPLKPAQAAAQREADTSCRSAGGERKTILGFEAVLVTQDLPGPPDSVRRLESWRAPILGCFSLQEAYLMGSPGGAALTVVNESRVLEVKAGSPDPSLFAIPAGYTERSPSEVVQEYSRRYEAFKKPSACLECRSMSKQDEAYFHHQKR